MIEYVEFILNSIFEYLFDIWRNSCRPTLLPFLNVIFLVFEMQKYFAVFIVCCSFLSLVDCLICGYGGYCIADSDCIPGFSCGNKSPTYSQCIPAPTDHCIVTYGTCGGLTWNYYYFPSEKCFFFF